MNATSLTGLLAGAALAVVLVGLHSVWTRHRWVKQLASEAAARPAAPPRETMPMKIAITTRSGGNARHCTNLQETTLTCAAVRERGIRVDHVLRVAGDARGCEAQPLVVPNVEIGGRARDIHVLASMANVVQAHDAETGEQLWTRRLGVPIKGTRQIDAYLINDHWGILSTGTVFGTDLFVVAWVSPTGLAENGEFNLYEIDLCTGRIESVTSLSSATHEPGHGLPTQRFDAAQRKQRCSLLQANGTLYIGFGTIAEISSTAQGWIIAVDVSRASAPRIRDALSTTSRGTGAGIWMAGQGLSMDAQGYIYCMTGNGDFDAITDFGNCVLKIGWVNDRLTVVDWHAPFSDAGREGDDPARAPRDKVRRSVDGRANNLMPSMADGDDSMSGMPDMDAVSPTNERIGGLMRMAATGQYADMDLGSAAPQPIDARDLVVGAGKDGVLYCWRKSDLGKTLPQDLRRPAGNYAKLAAPPIFGTYYAPDKDPAPNDVTELNMLYGGKTHHMHSSMVYYRSRRHGDQLFMWGENGTLKCYLLPSDAALKSRGPQFLAESEEIASADCVNPPGGMPGGMMFLTANGDQDAILWATIPYGDANMTVTQGRLLAYDAENFVNGRIQVIWDSQRWNQQFVFNKFCPPVVANGRVLRPQYDGGTTVFTLA